MNPIVQNNRRLSACALAIASLSAHSAGAADITTNITGNYVVGTTGTTSVVTISPAVGGGVTFTGDLQLAVGPLTATTLNIGATRNTVTGRFTTNDQTMNFTLAADAANRFDVTNGTGSGQIAVTQSSGTGLVMSGGERIGLTLTGSLKNGASSLLINNTADGSAFNVSSFDKTEIGTLVSDNSFVINSHVWKDDNDLRYTANRGKNEYTFKSDTVGHFSNPAALALGTIAFQGSQRGDLATVIEQIDLDGYGFGNNQANLAEQVKRLAPVANNAYTLSTLSATSQMLANMDDRLASLRGDVPAEKPNGKESLWVRTTVSNAKQSAVDAYDGYNTSFLGLSVGADHKVDNRWLGVAINMGNSDIDQTGFRAGDSAQLSSRQLSVYGAIESGAFYANGVLAYGATGLLGKRTAAIDRVADASFNTRSTDLKLGAGHRIKFNDGKSTLTPNIAFLSTSLKQDEYTETGAGDLGLHFDEKNFTRIRASVGLKFNTEGHMAKKMAYSSFYMNYSRDTGLDNLDVTANYSGLTSTALTTFTTEAAQYARNSVQFGGGFSLATSKASSLQVRYELDHRQAFNSHGLQIQSLWKF